MPTVRTAQAVPIALPGLQVTTYGTATAVPIGISNNRKTVYGSASGTGTALYQSTNDGTTWTSVHTFAESLLGVLETDDGEALAFTQNGASTPGYIYKSTGWATSHTTATWRKVLTTVGGYIRPWWGGGHFCSFGNDSINANTSKVGVVCEYGTQTPGTNYGTRVYLTQDYGATWTLILDLAVRYPGVTPLHTHAAAYDPYWGRLWVLYGDTQADGNTKAEVLYSDDLGVTWAPLSLSGDWSGTGFGFQCTSIAVLRDCILLGSDNAPGWMRLGRTGYRKVGDLQVTMVEASGTSSQMIASGAHRNRTQPSAPVLMAFVSQAANLTPGLRISTDEGATLVRLWGDDSLRNSSMGPNTVFGPTWTGKILANVNAPSSAHWLLVGELIVPDPGMMDGAGTVAGDGTTTVFSFLHGLPATPSKFLAWNEKPTGAYAVTATATNIVVTYTTAPAAASSVPFQWRAAP